MREIKFRVWDDKEMNYDPSDFPGDLQYTMINEVFKNDTWLQYTGLKDKNNKDIYEGDIIKDNHGNVAKVYWNDYPSAWQISGKTHYGSLWCGFVPRKYNEETFELEELCDFEIIGNIYENPELLQNK